MNGPKPNNVVLDCYAEKEHLSSEPHQWWQHGSMYDNVRTDAQFKLNRAAGSHGQRAANCLLWNITSDNKRSFEPDIYLDKPVLDLGQQWAIGIVNHGTGSGIASPSPEDNFSDAAFVESVGQFVQPRSLYLAQLKDRLGQNAVDNIISPEQNISCQAVWDKMIEQYQSIPEFGDPNDLSWLPSCDNNSTSVDISTDESNTFEFYPNPASNKLSLVFKRSEMTTIDIYSVSGCRVKSCIVQGSNTVIDIGDLNEGIYLLEINSNSIHVKEKLIINR